MSFEENKNNTSYPAGEIMGHAPSGEKVTMNVIDIVRLKD